MADRQPLSVHLRVGEYLAALSSRPVPEAKVSTHWLVRKHRCPGFHPWYTLHRRRSLLGVTWWSFTVAWHAQLDCVELYAHEWDRVVDGIYN